MSDLPLPPDTDDQPANPQRRRLLGGLAAAGAGLALGGAGAEAIAGAGPAAAAPTKLDALLRERIQRVVVIYAENRSFNNLFANFPGVAEPLSALKPEQYRQRDRDGTLLKTLPPVWHGVAPHEQVVNHRKYVVRQEDLSGLPNRSEEH